MLHTMRSAAKYIWVLIALAFIGGFLFYQVSGLGGRQSVTPGTAVGSVNGRDITQAEWSRAYTQLINSQQQSGQALNDDEIQRMKDQAFSSIVNDILLQQEIARRGISVTNDEIRQAALNSPPPDLASNPELQTNGQFDLQKYQRLLSSSVARDQGLLVQLEQYYRSQIPRSKLFDQIASTVYVTDAELWRAWRDARDSASVTVAAWSPDIVPDTAVQVSEAEIQAYYDANSKALADRPGVAVLTVTRIPRVISASDTAAALARAQSLRQEIVNGAAFGDVAKRESADSASAVQGGSLGPVTRDAVVKPFSDAVFSLPVGQLSQPVLTRFGYHLIRVDERSGDTATARHILIPIQQSDSAAVATDRLADQLARLAAAQSGQPARFDAAVRQLGLDTARIVVTQGDRAMWAGTYVPGVSAWAFSGVKPGDTSDLQDAGNAYYLARLDSLQPGGKPPLSAMRDRIRSRLVRQKKIQALLPRAQRAAAAIAGGATLERAAHAAGATLDTTDLFTRGSAVPALGQLNEAVGAAFGLPEGSVSQPVATSDAVYLLRVDRRIEASRAEWEQQKAAQRQAVLDQLRQQRVQEYLANLRAAASVEDSRARIEQALRAPVS